MCLLSIFNLGAAFIQVDNDKTYEKYPFCGDELLYRGK